MITDYHIHNFKNHADTQLSLSNLTLLTGVNGMGKSSVFQTMLLLRDSFFMQNDMRSLFLTGKSCRVGGSSELINGSISDKNDPDKLRIDLADDKKQLSFTYQYPVAENAFELKRVEAGPSLDVDTLKHFSIFTDDFQYLSAFRYGPKEDYPADGVDVQSHRQVSSQMGMGEYAATFLSLYGREDIPISSLMHDENSSKKLIDQTQLWLGEISPHLQMKLNKPSDKLKLEFGYQREGYQTLWHSAMNTGFGITYVMSIVVAILSARPGALILLENPEAHVHPSGQAALMRLVTKAAEAGVQIMIETHSDHIINGALVNAKKNVISPDHIAVYYFTMDELLNAEVQKLEIGDNFRFRKAPRGFFDQMGIDLEELYDF